MIEALSDINIWISLTTLTLLEIVLGIDNIIFISILSQKLKKEEIVKGQRYGLALAMIFRIILVFGIAYIIGLTEPLFHLFDQPIGVKDLILLLGGIFLIYQSVIEIHEKIEPEEEHEKKGASGISSLRNVLVQIALINIVFSFDSILTAVGLVEVNPQANLWTEPGIYVMIVAIILSMIFMMVFTNKVGDFIEERPTLKVLALSFLIMIGFMLLLEAFHVEVPKGYAYFAMAFAFGVELLNLRVRRKVPSL
jgi:predicted tellurium resistance membrane protein TerC